MPYVSVIAVIPLPIELGGNGDVLVLEESRCHTLPMGEPLPGELVMDAVRRVVREKAGVVVEPIRLLYIAEERGEQVVFGILCEIQLDQNAIPEDRAQFVDVSKLNRILEPAWIVETLAEDAASGFHRPVAHIVVIRDDNGKESTTITW